MNPGGCQGKKALEKSYYYKKPIKFRQDELPVE